MKESVKELLKKCLEMCVEEIELPLVENGVVVEDPDNCDLYGHKSIVSLMGDKERANANACIRRTALYMDLPHIHGRDVRGENDFAAIRLATSLYLCYDKYEDETKRLVKQFLLERDFTSMYGSENHHMMMHIARYLAAQFYKGETFKQYGLTAEEALAIDKKWLIDFLSWRAKYGFGEFDSSGYLGEDMMMVSMLDCYAEDKEIQSLGHMMVNLIALEMFNNIDKFGYSAGARGRSYPGPYTSTAKERFRKQYIDMEPCYNLNFVIAPAFPDEWVLDTYRQRQYPCEVYERKNLHSMYAWEGNTPDWEKLDDINKAGCINKYTYLCDEYTIGAINHQDFYPEKYPYDGGYAHHQQVEWTLWLPCEDEVEATKLFSHHPGHCGEHNRWTGDIHCCCNNSYATKDTCITVYNIEKEKEDDYTHMFFEPHKYDAIKYETNGVFLKKDCRYVFVYVAKPYSVGVESEFGRDEIKSVGRKNAWAVRVGLEKDYGSFDAFIEAMKKLHISFDEDNMVFEFDNLSVSRPFHNTVDGKENAYPYANVYDTPWVKSVWGEGVVEVISGGKTYVMDFNKIDTYTK